MFGNRRSVIRVLNSVQAKQGDGVILGLQERALTLGSLLLYIFPLLTMISGAGVARWIGSVAVPLSAEPLSIAGGLFGLAVGILGMNKVGTWFGIHGSTQAVIVRSIAGAAISAHAIQVRNLES